MTLVFSLRSLRVFHFAFSAVKKLTAKFAKIYAKGAKFAKVLYRFKVQSPLSLHPFHLPSAFVRFHSVLIFYVRKFFHDVAAYSPGRFT